MIDLLMNFLRFLFYGYIFYIAFIVVKVIFDVAMAAIKYYFYGEKPKPASKQPKQENNYYTFWDD